MTTRRACPHCIGGTLIEQGRGTGYWQCILCSRVTESRPHDAMEEIVFHSIGSPSIGGLILSQQPYDEDETMRHADADAWINLKGRIPHPRRGDRAKNMPTIEGEGR